MFGEENEKVRVSASETSANTKKWNDITQKTSSHCSLSASRTIAGPRKRDEIKTNINLVARLNPVPCYGKTQVQALSARLENLHYLMISDVKCD